MPPRGMSKTEHEENHMPSDKVREKKKQQIMRKFSGAKYFDHAENTLDYAEILTVNNEFRGANSIGFETGSIRTAQQ